MIDDPTNDLKLMLVDQSDQRRQILEKILKEHGYWNIFATSGLDDLFSLVTQLEPDVVLIELDSPKRDTLEQLRHVRERRPTPVVMFAQDQDAQTVRAAVDSGVCAYLVDSVDRGKVKPAIALAMATFDAYRRLREEADHYKHRVKGQKQIDQAKALLMRRDQLDEEQAYRLLRKIAMDQNQRLYDVAMEIIADHNI